jgi:outer membrane protein OmpA-like peptidoglycan-associated protein
MFGRTLFLCALAFPAAAAPLAGPYVGLGGGLNVLQDQLERPSLAGAGGRSYTFDPGATGHADIGYGFGNGLRIEIEGDVGDDHVRGLRAALPGRAGGFERQYGGLLNVLYDIPVDGAVHPYIGLGAGYQQVELKGVNSGPYGFAFDAGSRGESGGNFAYQAIAGLSYPIPGVDRLSLTLDYRFLGVLDIDGYRRDLTTERGAVPFTSTFADIFNHQLTIGLRYAFAGAPPPPSPAPVASAPSPAAARTFLVFFDWDRADLTDRARAIVGEAAQASTGARITTIAVDGYADTSHAQPGEKGLAYNQALSLRRADAVRAELVRDGVPASIIDVRGYGQSHPLVPTGPNAREPQNRRVEIDLR